MLLLSYKTNFFCSLLIKVFKSPISFTSCFISKISLSNNSSQYLSGFGIYFIYDFIKVILSVPSHSPYFLDAGETLSNFITGYLIWPNEP